MRTMKFPRLLRRDLALNQSRLRRLNEQPEKVGGKLVDAINDSAKSIGAQSVTFLVTTLYLALSTASVNDEILLLRDKIGLPIVNVGIPVHWFFRLAPGLLLVLHCTILLQEYFLLQRLALLKWNRSEVDVSLFHPSISINRHFHWCHSLSVRILLHLVFILVYYAFPLVVMTFFLIRFLPYHDLVITAWCWFCILVDVLAIMGFAWLSYRMKRREKNLWTGYSWPESFRRPLVAYAGLASAGLSILLLLFCGQYIFMPEVCSGAPERLLGLLTVRRDLSLSEKSLVLREPESGLDPDSKVLRERIREKTQGMSFRKRDLRCADFSGAKLVNADFRGADLRGAIFDRADLRGAIFSDASSSEVKSLGGGLHRSTTRMDRASFAYANLSRANLSGVSLRRADLTGAVLHEAKLVEAELFGVVGWGAEFLAADLTNANLRGADFRDGDFRFALLPSARLELARFHGASLQGADFRRALVEGADFRDAKLEGSRGLALLSIDLRGATLRGMDSCSDSNDRYVAPTPYLADLRFVRFDPADWQTLLDSLNLEAQAPLKSETLRRVDESLASLRSGSLTCLLNLPLPAQGPGEEAKVEREKFLQTQILLYDRLRIGDLFQELPDPAQAQPPLTEDAYMVELARYLVDRVCARDASERNDFYQEKLTLFQHVSEFLRKQFQRNGPTGEEALTLSLFLRERSKQEDEFAEFLRKEIQASPCIP
jgi:uncharacterized protein YjbI with pentapeptide repeats